MAFVSRPGIYRTPKTAGTRNVNPRPSCLWSYLVVLGKGGTLAPGLGKLGNELVLGPCIMAKVIESKILAKLR